VDEKRLTELFQAAAASEADDGPSATFSHADVVAASRQQTHRRRQLAAGGVAFGLVALLGTGIGVAQLAGQQTAADTASAPVLAEQQPRRDAAGPGAEEDAAAGAPAPATTGCVTPDTELGAAVAQVLPPAAGARAQPVPSPCTAGARAVQLAVTDGGRGDVLRVVLGQQASGSVLPPGAASRTVTTASGASLTVSALSGVLADRLDALAQALAARY